MADAGDLRHHLHGGGTGADDADTLVRQLVHGLSGAAARIAVVPATGVEGLAFEVFNPGDARQLGLVQDAPGQHQEAGREVVAPAGGHVPAPCLLVPHGPGDVGLEERVGVEVERASQQLGVLEDLRGAGVVLGRHEAGLLEQGQVHVGLHVAHAARIAVPVPGAPEVAGLLDDPEVGDPVLAEVDGGEHPGEAATHDHHCGLFDHGVPGEAGLNERVSVQVLTRLTPLRHAVGTQPLLLLLPIPLAQLVDRGALCAAVLFHHSCSSVGDRPHRLETSQCVASLHPILGVRCRRPGSRPQS